ncbi:hypothetical protein HanPI659440_Chr04g0157611 [Helianthus annuus]|nr:hypothetical protein HanPI659440_Chr04g0157611 [Helianthus annuus]
MPHVLFLGNQLGDVETLLGQRIPLGRDFPFSLLHALSLSLQSKTLILLLFNHRPFLFGYPNILCLSSPTSCFIHALIQPSLCGLFRRRQ